MCMEKQGCFCLLCQEGHVPPSFDVLGSHGLPLLHLSVCTYGGGSPAEPLGQRSELLQLGLAAGKALRRKQGLELGWIT